MTKNKKTIIVHGIFLALEGIIFGLFLLAPSILRREMQATKLIITIFIMLMPVSSLFSIYFSQLLTKNPTKIKKFILIVATTTRLPLFFFLFWHSTLSIIIFSALFYIGISFFKPVQNIFIKSNYNQKTMGKTYGYLMSINKIFAMISTYLLGKTMDINNKSFIFIFAMVGILAFFSATTLLLIPFDNWQNEKKNKEKRDLFLIPTLINVFKKNNKFFIYEIAFFIYGGGFMVVLPSIPVLLVDKLKFTYTIISTGQGVVAAIATIIFIPLFGKIFDKKNPIYLGKFIFFLLTFYPLTLLLSAFTPHSITKYISYIAFFIFGTAMAGVTIIWNIGPITFAKNYKEISQLTSVHITMTGIRGLIMPILGYLMLKASIYLPFIASAIFFLTSSMVMKYLEKHK